MEVFSLGENNKFKKNSLFEKESFYIVLFVCLCIVAVTAVYMTRSNSSTKEKVSQKSTTKQSTPQTQTKPLTTTNKPKTQMTSKQQVKTIKDVSKEMAKAKKLSLSKTSKSVASKNFKLLYPVKGNILKGYDSENLQYSQTMNQWETHEGVDIASDLGTEVKAAMGGTVVEVITKNEAVNEFDKSGYGDGIVIDHGNGYRTEYLNLAVDSIKLKKGNVVKAGQVIGTIGETSGRESVALEGSHLCFSLLKKSGKDYVSVNPEKFLK
jgi:murein DD-endopeptidase MepM/ murein hydrolase activator NlpD